MKSHGNSMKGIMSPDEPWQQNSPERIWLEPECCADPSIGQQWCQDNVWIGTCEDGVEATEYIRAGRPLWENMWRKCGKAGINADFSRGHQSLPHGPTEIND